MNAVSRIAPAAGLEFPRYLLTIHAHGESTPFRDDDVVAATVSEFRRTAKEEGFAILAYCFMPDQAQVLVGATGERMDVRRFITRAKQRATRACDGSCRLPLWKSGYQERLLGPDTDPREVARYVLWSPFRAGLVEEPAMYQHVGSDAWPVQDLVAL